MHQKRLLKEIKRLRDKEIKRLTYEKERAMEEDPPNMKKAKDCLMQVKTCKETIVMLKECLPMGFKMED